MKKKINLVINIFKIFKNVVIPVFESKNVLLIVSLFIYIFSTLLLAKFDKYIDSSNKKLVFLTRLIILSCFTISFLLLLCVSTPLDLKTLHETVIELSKSSENDN